MNYIVGASLVPEFSVEDLCLGKTASLVPEFSVEDLILGKTASLLPEFSVEDLPLGRIASLVPEFAVKDLPFGITLMILLRIEYDFASKFSLRPCALKHAQKTFILESISDLRYLA